MIDKLCPVKNFIRPDKPHGCTYEEALKNPSIVCPHTSNVKPARNSNTINRNVLDMIGNTPLVKLDNLTKDYKINCNLYAKCEFFNAGGSIKDRIALRMIEEAEKSGKLKPGDYVIEPTSGNTGVGLALTCAVKGYKCIIVMPEKMSKEKSDVLKGLGATIIRTPTKAAFDDIDSHISEAQRIMERLNAKNPGCAHILDQYTNPYNPIAHYDGTGEEILNQLNGKVDYLIASAGTGGTICGLARKIKERCPDCKIVGVDPVGSILAMPEKLNEDKGAGFYEVEGIGYDFLPTVLDRSRVDYWYKSVDRDSFQMSRQLIRREGLLCGGSSGSAAYCAIQAIKKFNVKEGDNVVVILPDSIRNYMTKYLSEEWCVTRGFLDVEEDEKNDFWWTHKPISAMADFVTPIADNIVDASLTCAQVLDRMKSKSIDTVLVFKEGVMTEVVTKKNIMNKLVIGACKPTDLVELAALDRHIMLKKSDTVKQLQCCLDAEGYAIVSNGAPSSTMNEKNLFGVFTADTFLSYLTSEDAKT